MSKGKYVPPQYRASWSWVHRVLRWRWRLTMVVWCNFSPSSPVTRICNRLLDRLWPFTWAQRQHSQAFIWCCMQPSPMMVHLGLAKTFSHEQGDSDG